MSKDPNPTVIFKTAREFGELFAEAYEDLEAFTILSELWEIFIFEIVPQRWQHAADSMHIKGYTDAITTKEIGQLGKFLAGKISENDFNYGTR